MIGPSAVAVIRLGIIARNETEPHVGFDVVTQLRR